MNYVHDSSIYNINRMYNPGDLRNRMNYPTKPDANGFYQVKNYAVNYDDVSYKNSDGRHLD